MSTPRSRRSSTSSKEEREASTSGWDGLRKPWVRPALIVGCGIAVFTQLSGIEMIIYYAPTILTDNGFSDTAALRVSVALGVTYLVMMIVGLSIVDRVGRRRLSLIMIPGRRAQPDRPRRDLRVRARRQEHHRAHHRLPHRLHVLQRRRTAAHGLADRLGDLPARGPLGAGRSAQSATLWSTNLLITLTLLTMIEGIGVGETFWVYAALQPRRVALRLPADAGAHRAQPRADRGIAAARQLPPEGLRAPDAGGGGGLR